MSSAGYLAVVRAKAHEAPDAVAFELSRATGSSVLSYGDLVARVARLGAAMRRAGHGDGERVAICMENRPAWPVGYLATWYAGGVTVPLDPAQDETVLGRLLEHSEALLCLTSLELYEKLVTACATLPRPPLVLVVGPASGAAEQAVWGEDESWDGAPSVSVPVHADEDVAKATTWDAYVLAHGPDGDPGWDPAPVGSGDLGSIMYTSGTTGDPKGVMIRRTAVLENVEAALKRVHFLPSDRILGVLPLFHVLPLITNCLGPLYLGARVVFLYELTAEGIMAAFRRHEITVFVCVPAFFYRFHDRLQSGLQSAPPLRRKVATLLLAVSRQTRRHLGWNLGRRLLSQAHAPFGKQMRLFITGGAKMSAAVFDDFLDFGFTLAQGYGLTEATAVLTATPLDELRGDTVGRAIEGVELRVHEPNEEGIGEVWARGPSLMTGYYKSPAATAEVLADGWLKTGDLGRLLADGHLQITGRAKDVIVLASGKNIYPDELEGYYQQSELVEEMCIVGVPDAQGRGETLHAVVVPDLAAARRRGYVNVREMVKWDLESAGAKLPGPQRLTSLEVRNEPLPRTSTRKIKRFLVLQQVQESGGREDRRADADPGATVAARSIDEWPVWGTEVVAVIERYARGARVSTDAHLDLDLGLESLDRIELLTELQQRFSLQLGEDKAGEIHTVAELLDAIGETGQGGAGGAEPVAEGDRWSQLLDTRPAGVDRYLRRRPLVELILWVVLRVGRLFWHAGAGFTAEGLDNIPEEGAFVLCANHSSYVDPILLCMALPRRALSRIFFVGYSEYFEGFLSRPVGRLVRNIPIDSNRNLERAMQAAAAGLRKGLVLVIFPEGARSLDGDVRPFRRGAAILSRNLDVPMVPAGIWGADQAWPREGSLKRHPVSIAFGAVLQADARAEGGDAAKLERLRQRVISLIDAARAAQKPSGG